MIRHLTRADYRAMPWANGRGSTLELLKQDGAEGIDWRLSIATVAEDGAFSLLPGIDRTLTVIDGPGFRLQGAGLALEAVPFAPIRFPGEAALCATSVSAPSMDFNVMTRRGHYVHEVRMAAPGPLPAGVFLLALAAGEVWLEGQSRVVARHDLLILPRAVDLGHAPPLLAVNLSPAALAAASAGPAGH